jgi:hypothetical protein
MLVVGFQIANRCWDYFVTQIYNFAGATGLVLFSGLLNHLLKEVLYLCITVGILSSFLLHKY